MMALDEFVLWVNADKPYKTVEGIHRRHQGSVPTISSRWAARARSRKTRSSRSRLKRLTGKKMTYIPYKGGGAVAVQLVGEHVDSTVNNPIEAVAHWQRGQAASALRVRLQEARLQREDLQPIRVVERHSDLQVGRARRRVSDAARLSSCRRVSSRTQVAYYVDLFKKVRETPEWKKLMSDGAFNQTFMTGDDYAKWVAARREAA